MKYLKSRVLENISFAKAILRKSGVEQTDEKYLKIIEKTNRDGYTGLITKLVFIDNVELDEALDLYEILKDKKIDVSKLNKMSYDTILDLVYQDDVKENENDIQFIFKYKDYRVFRVKTYEAGLNINSPAWCLKTKTHYDTYTKQKRGTNFVAIKEEFFKKGLLLLPTPNTYMGSSYNNSKRPDIRLGYTVYQNDTYDCFNDNNTNIKGGGLDPYTRQLNLNIVGEILEEILLWLRKDVKDIIITSSKYSDYRDILSELIEDVDIYGSFNDKAFKLTAEVKIALERIYNTNLYIDYNNNMNVEEFLEKYKDDVLSDPTLTQKDGFHDIFLYEFYKKDGVIYELSGMLLGELEDYDKCFRYTYGMHKFYYGREYIKQSYNSVKDYMDVLASLFHIFIIGDSDHYNLYDFYY
jgi:hypothetical protein